MILYLTSDNHLTGPEGGVRKWQTVHWNGTEWVYSDITTSTHCYDSGSLWIDDEDVWTVIAPTDIGPQYWGTGGEMVMWRSRDKGQTWKRVRTLTHDSPRNHGYARRPLHADPDFYAFWAESRRAEHLVPLFLQRQGRCFPHALHDERRVAEARARTRRKTPRLTFILSLTA